MSDLRQALKDNADAVNKMMDSLIPKADGGQGKLFEAMRYAATSGGKRMRPFLVVQSTGLFGLTHQTALRTAAAVEFIHAYSLVHDDLPAMDNSYLRRGKPTTHVQYGEAVAILVGDALLTLAFEVINDFDTHPDPVVRANLVTALAQAAGARGMVGGQMLDIQSSGNELSMAEIVRLQRLKTGELFSFCCEAGAILAKTPGRARQSLSSYAHDLGLAFQITDDLLDAAGSTAETGKSVRQDAENNKPNFVTLLGIERAKSQAQILAQQAVSHLDQFDERADLLRELAQYAVDRKF
jgi:farnesyl diphosphate synthase